MQSYYFLFPVVFEFLLQILRPISPEMHGTLFPLHALRYLYLRKNKLILDIRVCAGNGIGLEGDENKITEWVSIPAFKGCRGIMVFGDSMYDKYKSGDIIFVRRIESRNDIDYGQCYVVITQEDRYIKNLYESSKGDGYITMVSYNMELNPDGRRKFPDRDIAKSEILFLYKVAGKLRRNQL